MKIVKLDSVISAIKKSHKHPDRERYLINQVRAIAKDIPKVICLCGSTRFKEAFEKAERDIALRGEICLTVGLFGHIEGLDMSGVDKAKLDVLHFRKIDMADEVFIVSENGYIGASTKNEIKYATQQGKQIKYMEVTAEQDARTYLMALEDVKQEGV